MSQPLILGWEEWVALPALGLPAIKAKIDTGAKTSALHAHLIEPYSTPDGQRVRFIIHPAPGRDALEVVCEAPLKDYREVASSNGNRETRAVIETEIAIGDDRWPIEITLTNRASMAYRMLIGRQALQRGVLVDPSGSFLQPRLGYRVYDRLGAAVVAPAHRAFAIAVLTRRPASASVKRLEDAARRAGHDLDVLDVANLEIALDGSGRLMRDRRDLAHYDAVVPRVGAGKGAVFANACVRQLEARGTVALNPAEALERLRNKALMAQVLDRVRLASAAGQLSDTLEAAPDEEPRAHDGQGAILRCLVVGGHVAAVAEARGRELVADRPGTTGPVVKMARRAALALGLGLAAIDIDGADETIAGARVKSVSALPALAAFQQVCGIDAAARVLAETEALVRGRSAGRDR